LVLEFLDSHPVEADELVDVGT